MTGTYRTPPEKSGGVFFVTRGPDSLFPAPFSLVSGIIRLPAGISALETERRLC